MSIITIPSGLEVLKQQFGEQRFDLLFGSGDTGAQQGRVLGPPRWTCGLSADETMDASMAVAWRQLVLSLQGRVNQLAVSDLLNPAPKGTARGTWSSLYYNAPGVMAMWLDMGMDQVGKTILPGDWFGVNQATSGRQLLHAQTGFLVDASGHAYVEFMQPLRLAVVAGSPVVWNAPTCLMRRTTSSTSWASARSSQGGFSIDLSESWE